MPSTPLSPPLSPGTRRLEIKKSSFAGRRQLWALGPGRCGPYLTVPVHSLPGLKGWESHYHLATEPGWSEEGHGGLAGVSVTQARAGSCLGTVPCSVFLPLLSASCSLPHIPASAGVWGVSAGSPWERRGRPRGDTWVYEGEISVALALACT